MSTSPIDLDTLNTLLDAVGGDPEFLVELLDEFFKDTPRQFQTMEEALSTNNAEAFRRAAHSMKSNSANFGAMNLSRLCKELEDIGKNNPLDQAPPLLVQAKTEYQQVKTALESIMKEM